jgi:hypothetical protein
MRKKFTLNYNFLKFLYAFEIKTTKQQFFSFQSIPREKENNQETELVPKPLPESMDSSKSKGEPKA